MKKLVLAFLLMASPAFAQQSKLVGVSGKGADDCKPIGRTADGKLVYSMKCEYLPIPATPAPAAPSAERETAPPQTEVVEDDKGGMFKFPFSGTSLGVNTTRQMPGVGPAGSR